MATETRNPWLPGELDSIQRQRNPFPWFREMRNQSPVRYDETRNTYDVFRYDAVCEVMEDIDAFTREQTSYIEDHMAATNPPLHTELRGGLAKYFTPRSLEDIRQTVESRTQTLVDEALEGDDRVDFIEEIAKPLPILVIAGMLGVPAEEMDRFREWSTTLAAAPEAPTEEARRRFERRQAEALSEVKAFFEHELQARESDPQDDLITTILRMEESSDLIDRDNAVAQCAHLLIAGNITTTEFMANAIWTFVEEDCIQELRSGEYELEPALQEVLRYRPSVLTGKRYTTTDVEIGAVELPEGSRVIGWIGSANRDEEVFDDPDQFVPDREPATMAIPFGKGPRHCLGSSLALLEGEIVISTFLDAIESIELTRETIEPFYSNEVYGPEELPLRVQT